MQLREQRENGDEDLLRDALYYELFDEAERVRWKMSDIPFSSIQKDLVSPGLLALIRDIAASELTTFSATRSFLREFADDVDFTQWMSVWFYEESKHPVVLMRWLAEFGVTFDSSFVVRGRATASFMKSRFGMLVTNVISELVASNNYLNLHKNSAEPVLAGIARHLATDEARHAKSFLAYARRWLERSRDPDSDRMDALKVLYVWFQDNERVKHPVSEFQARSTGSDQTAQAMRELHLDQNGAAERACRTIASLVGCRLERPEQIVDELARLRARVEERKGADGQT